MLIVGSTLGLLGYQQDIFCPSDTFWRFSASIFQLVRWGFFWLLFRGMRKAVLVVFVALVLLCGAGLSVSKLRHIEGASDPLQQREALYLPRIEALKVVSIGYRAPLADFIWFKTISYFGREFRGEKNYRWLGHMCDVVTTLNPYVPEFYRFCSTMLSWEIGAYDESNRLLSRAMKNIPNNWLFPYLRGFNYLFFLKDQALARNDFISAAKIPGVHPVVASLAAKVHMEVDSPDIARLTIKGLIELTDDPIVREALEARLKEIEKP